MLNHFTGKVKEIIPALRTAIKVGIIAIGKGLLGIITEIGYALAVMLVAFLISFLLTSF